MIFRRQPATARYGARLLFHKILEPETHRFPADERLTNSFSGVLSEYSSGL